MFRRKSLAHRIPKLDIIIEEIKIKLLLKSYVIIRRRLNCRNKLTILTIGLKSHTL